MVINFAVNRIGKNKEAHSHDYAQFVIPCEGYVFLETSDKKQVIDGKSLGYIPANQEHCFYSDLGHEALVINVGDQILKFEDRFTFAQNAPFILDVSLKSIIDILRKEVVNQENQDSLKYLFFYIYDKLTQTRNYKSLSYIHKNYHYDISIKTLADLEHYNSNYFSVWFKKQIGLSPVSYIKRVRIEAVKNLLLTTRYNLTQIALQTGYSQSSTMCKVFKDLEGCTPKQYRSQFINDSLCGVEGAYEQSHH